MQISSDVNLRSSRGFSTINLKLQFMATIRETILKVKPGKPKAIPLSEVSDVMGFRSEALRINNDLRKDGVKTKEGKPPYSVSKNSRVGFFYIINNIEKT